MPVDGSFGPPGSRCPRAPLGGSRRTPTLTIWTGRERTILAHAQSVCSQLQPIASHATQLVRIRRRETPLTTRPHHAPARATRARGRALTLACSQHGLRHGRLPRVRSVQPRKGHVWLPYLHGRADDASDGRAPEPVRQAVQRRQGLQRIGRLLREHVPCRRHPLRRPLCQAGLGV